MPEGFSQTPKDPLIGHKRVLESLQAKLATRGLKPAPEGADGVEQDPVDSDVEIVPGFGSPELNSTVHNVLESHRNAKNQLH